MANPLNNSLFKTAIVLYYSKLESLFLYNYYCEIIITILHRFIELVEVGMNVLSMYFLNN